MMFQMAKSKMMFIKYIYIYNNNINKDRHGGDS